MQNNTHIQEAKTILPKPYWLVANHLFLESELLRERAVGALVGRFEVF